MNAGAESKVPWLIWIAILVSFFPCGILYPLSYPVREIATLLLWIWAFPSWMGCLSVLLLPLLPSDAYGYFAFNLFCITGTLGTGARVIRRAATSAMLAVPLHRLARACLLISLALAAWQAFDGENWLAAFPAMQAIGTGRGGGLRPEPSLLAPPLAMYLALVLWRRMQSAVDGKVERRLFVEAGVLSLTTLLLTHSLSVAIILICYLPAFTSKLRYLFVSAMGVAILGASVFWDRVRDAFSSGETFSYLITTAIGSWRNVPDILILVNIRDYLLPSHPAELREKLNQLAIMWSPGLAWLDNTYSTFSASASTVGVIATVILFGAGLFVGICKVSRANHMRTTWLLLYIADWFVLPKYEPCGWVGLGLLTAAAAADCLRSAVAPIQRIPLMPDTANTGSLSAH
jgi:hypothetical protein